MKVSIHDQMPNPIYLRSHQNQVVNTPYKVVKSLLDSLPSHVWSQKDLRWLMPVSKSGAFEIEVFRRLFVGLKDVIVDPIERRDWIVQKMIHSFCASKATEALTKRNFIGQVYGVKKYDGIDCNIWIVDFMKTKVNKQTGEIVAQTTDGEKKFVKFDCIVGNPPYQKNIGTAGKGSRAIALYPLFVLQALSMNPTYMSMVIPSKCLTKNGCGEGLSEMLELLIKSNKLANIITEQIHDNWFPDAEIRGEAMHFLYDATQNSSIVKINGISSDLKNQSVIITDMIGLSIRDKVLSNCKSFFEDKDLGQMPYGIKSAHKDGWSDANDSSTVVCYCRENNIATKKLILRSQIKKNTNTISKYKVCITKAHGSGSDGTSSPFIAMPEEIVSETYRVMSIFDKEDEANNAMMFMKTKFAQFLLSLLKATHNISSKTMKYLPYLDFSKSYTDQELYTMFELTQEEIKHIEDTTKDFPMFKVKVERKGKKVKKEEKIAAAEIAA